MADVKLGMEILVGPDDITLQKKKTATFAQTAGEPGKEANLDNVKKAKTHRPWPPLPTLAGTVKGMNGDFIVSELPKPAPSGVNPDKEDGNTKPEAPAF